MPVFRAFGYLLLRGYHFEPCPRPADDAIIGLTDRFCLAAGLVPAIKPLTYAVAILEVRQDSNLHLLFRVSQADTNHKRLPFSRLSLIVFPLNYAPCGVICPLPSQPSTSCAW